MSNVKVNYKKLDHNHVSQLAKGFVTLLSHTSFA